MEKNFISLNYEVKQLIKEISANKFFNEPLNTSDLREMIYKHESDLKYFAEQQARKIDWSVFDKKDIKQVLIKYSKLGNHGCYQNDDTAYLFDLANDTTATTNHMMIAFARAVAPVPHGRPLGEQCDLWAYI